MSREIYTRMLWRRRDKPASGGAAGRADAAGRCDAAAPGDVWALDFQADQTSDGRPIRLVNIIDDYTREALIMHAARSIDADEVVACLDALVARRGRAPRFVRMDNGPELTSHALRDWCRFSGRRQRVHRARLPVAEPVRGVLHARVRDELLNGEQFACIAEARVLVDDWREDYNQRPPHSALGMLAPAVFAAAYTPGADA
jgi:putative transposase